MRKCPLMASSVSSGGTSGVDKAPGGTGPGFAQPLKWLSLTWEQYHSRVARSSVAVSPALAERLCAFVLDRFPFALEPVGAALRSVRSVGGAGSASPAIQAGGAGSASRSESCERTRRSFRVALERELQRLDLRDLPDTSPGVAAHVRLDQARRELIDACDGFFARESIAASLTPDERREILRGMVLTRAVDNRLKQFFASSDVTYQGVPFQGKGFRSLGQEAIYAAAIRLRRGQGWRGSDDDWRGDVVGPMIRDLGVALAMRGDAEAVRMVLNAQAAKDGPPMNGKDLHIEIGRAHV